MMNLLTDLFGSIRAGWLQYADGGMYLGVFFVAMLFLWLVCYDKLAEKKELFLFVVTITLLVLCPVSAFFLLKYQTAFFTYSQLFLLIPMTPVMAWAFTELVEILTDKWKKEVFAVLVIAFVLFMAGNLSTAGEHTNLAENSVKVPSEVEEVLALVCESDLELESETILAPDEVVEYARAYSADIRLLYGRNMWQKELNAYTYDTYAPELEEVHKWLNPGEGAERPVSDNLSSADALSVAKLFGASLLVLKEEQFVDEEVKAALVQNGYEEIARTAEYIIIELR